MLAFGFGEHLVAQTLDMYFRNKVPEFLEVLFGLGLGFAEFCCVA